MSDKALFAQSAGFSLAANLVLFALIASINGYHNPPERKLFVVDFIPQASAPSVPESPVPKTTAPQNTSSSPPSPSADERPKQQPDPRPVEKHAPAINEPVETAMAAEPAPEPEPAPTAQDAPDEPAPLAISAPEPAAEHTPLQPAPPDAAQTARAAEPEHSAPNGEYLDEDRLSHPPQFINRLSPEYPLFARKKGKTGVVVVEILIETDGSVSSAKAIKKAGWGLDEAAMDAVRESTFEPGRAGGLPVRSRFVVEYRFTLK